MQPNEDEAARGALDVQPISTPITATTPMTARNFFNLCNARMNGVSSAHSMTTARTELIALADRMAARRDAILAAWRDAIKRDPALSTGDSLPRAQLYDHIPELIWRFERELRRAAGTGAEPQDGAGSEPAAAHGLQRWQQGYDLREVTRELSRLNECVVNELELHLKSDPALDGEVMAAGRRIWAALYGTCIEESTAQFFTLQQREAAGHLTDLESALEEIRELEVQRAELWQQAAHDLRGNLAVVANATAGLSRVPSQTLPHERLLDILQRNVGSLHHLLDDVTSLARLQAGREHRQVQRTDMSRLLHELCDGLRELADQRQLFLHCSGPDSFEVDTDPIKTRRIAQNLILNAIKYTHRGGLTVSWGDSSPEDSKRWVLTISDTGPGMRNGSSLPLVTALEDATQGAHGVEVVKPDTTSALPPIAEAGEGIGLSIVKRLCELLDAAIEIESDASTGTTFRILLPRQYAPATN